MNDDMHFGELEQSAPQRGRRPDANRHYAVVPYGEPEEADLPIFVDLDVLADIEEHAASDTSVELGGVLLGGQYEDDAGRPFVVVSDSLRAQDYESTKGSFTFTHDTWAAITRERDEFPPELQMVGWYHTHPDWGVFLSGLDLFICDHFFNKRLDVAYVVDPCRGDRGMFQWTGDAGQRIRRTGGFFVAASRFRAAELEDYVAELSGAMPTSLSNRTGGGPSAAPVVHLHQPREAQPPWLVVAVTGLLTLQLLLVALVAWRTLAPPGAAAGDDGALAAAVEKLDASLTALEARRATDLSRERTQARVEFLDEAFRELKGADEGAIARLAERFDRTARLEEDVQSRDARIRELQSSLADQDQRLKKLETAAKLAEDRLKSDVASLERENAALVARLKTQAAAQQPATAAASGPPKKNAASGASPDASVWWWVIGGSLAALAVAAGVWWISGPAAEPKPAE